MKRIIYLFLFLGLTAGLKANNVRIITDPKVENITSGIGDLTFKIAWDNSWRDGFNWDAVYVFLKWKKTVEQEWRHAKFNDQFNTASTGYAVWMGKSTTTANVNEGAFIYRNEEAKGDAEVDVTLKWNLSDAGLTQADFTSNLVEMSLMCIEMVYVPKGAYYLGDGISRSTFRTKYRPILPEWDLIKNDGTMKIEATGTMANHEFTSPPERAANRVNEGRNHNYSNAWYSPAGTYLWTVTFKEPKQVRFFGVSGVAGYGGYVPSATWTLEGLKETGSTWMLLKEAAPTDWIIPPNGGDSYPVKKAIKVDQNLDKYISYRIRVTSGSGVMMNNISMTEVNLDTIYDNGYVVSDQIMYFNSESGVSAEDGDTWNGSISYGADTYPTGFDGFYVMKYEVSQEQWVRFLNKLSPTQQKTRTGLNLEMMENGSYVYGLDKSQPNFRNGIAIGSRINGGITFVNNLKNGDLNSQDDDGQTLACNYLSINDMLAYADWTGLRPLTEMEYEKMSRRPYPSSPGLRDWAAGSVLRAEFPGTIETTSEGRVSEHILGGANVNAGNKILGPVRVGSFASNADNPIQAGASYWGVMDLSGNLAEIYYSANPSVRSFYDQQHGYSHGNGALDATGNVNISTSYIPRGSAGIFGLRGGSFRSETDATNGNEIAVSDRSKMRSYFSSLDTRDSTVSFRLGHSTTSLYSQTSTNSFIKSYNSTLKLENNKVSTSVDMFDSVCAGATYRIEGSELLESASGTPVNHGRTTYIWYISNDASQWQIIPGENNKDLVYNKWLDESTTIRPVYIKRTVITSFGSHTTNYVRLMIINTNYSISRLVDTVKMSNQSLGFYAETTLGSNFRWRWKSAESGTYFSSSTSDIHPNNSATALVNNSYYIPRRSDFDQISKQDHVVQCEIRILGKCKKNIELKVHVEERLNVGIASSDIVMTNDPVKGCGVLMQDTRDGKVYATVKLNGKCWMAENLRYDLSGQYKVNPIAPAGENGFGYNYYIHANPTVINNACPAGWRIPKKSEVEAMIVSFGGWTGTGRKFRAGNYYNATRGYLPTNETGLGIMGTGYDVAQDWQSNGRISAVGDDNATQYHWNFYQSNDNIEPLNNGHTGAHYMPIRCIKR